MINHRFALPLVLVLSLSATSQTARKPATAPTAKPAEDTQLYRNTTFGFRYKIPYGWVDRTKEMAPADSSGAARENPPKADSAAPTAPKPTPPASGEVLLATFERPPNAPGDTVNSAVVIVAESATAYPGLKKAEDYLGPLTELATAKGFKTEGDPDIVEIDSRQLIRADFAKPLGSTKDNDKLTMRQSTLVLLTKGQIVSFTFIAGSADEVDDLIEGLNFAASRPRH